MQRLANPAGHRAGWVAARRLAAGTVPAQKRFLQIKSTKDFLDATVPYMATTYSRPDMVLVKGEGRTLWDADGNEYLDFTAGIAVTALGHCDPGVTDVIVDQAQTLVHSSNLYYNEWTPKLSRAMVEKTRESGGMADAARLFVANSGSEANEAALKFARKVGKLISPDKTEIIAFKGGFHGRTFGALSATFNPKYQDPFGPMVPGFRVAQLNDPESLNLVSDKTCGVIVEPIQGEGGVNAASFEWLQQLRAQCDKFGVVLIYDEIQCGLGRTGDLWAHAAAGPKAFPDIVTMAKALGNGYPIGATMVSEKVNSALKIGDHGTTFGGNPLASRVGHHVLERVSSPEILDNVKARHAQFKARVESWQTKFPGLVTEMRGRGLILGLQLSKAPDAVLASALKNGLLVITAGTNTIRIVPALTITQEEAKRGLDILEDALAVA